LSRIAGWLLGDSPAGVEKKFVSGEEKVREEVSKVKGVEVEDGCAGRREGSGEEGSAGVKVWSCRGGAVRNRLREGSGSGVGGWVKVSPVRRGR
jgi:hypothetical protein